jgi:hypothetical protein
MAPHRRAPRNFMLTPAMVGQAKSKKTGTTFFNFFPALSFASALAVFALVLSFVFQLIPGPLGSSASLSSDRQAKEVAMSPATDQSGQPVENAQGQNQSETASPGAPGSVMLAPQSPTSSTPGLAAGANEKSAAPDNSGSLPPVITWNNPTGRGGGGGDGGAISEAAPAPGTAAGIGGGAPNDLGSTQVLPYEGIVIPLEGVNSIAQSQPGVEATPPATASDRYVEPGGGPILGIPPTEQAGEITNYSSLSEPGQSIQAVPPVEKIVAEQPTGSENGPLRWIQLLLALFAVLTGVSAYILYKRNMR